MDSITQAALGAAIGEATLGRKIGGKGAIIGAIVATIPDLDVLLTPFFSTLEKISIHRGYSHSVLFCLLAATLFAFMMTKVKWTKHIRYRRLWMFNFLALFTHILLDAFTTYGTQLLLPFADWRVSFDSVNIIDPVYTIPLLVGAGLSIYLYPKEDLKRGFPNQIGLLISTLYLMFTLANKQHVQNIFADNLQSKNMPYYKMLTVPVKMGNLNWYGVAKDATHLRIGSYSIIDQNEVEFHSFPINDHLLVGLDTELVDRLKWFAKGYYTVAEHDGRIRVYNMQCDMQGVRTFGNYKAPTAFYYEITPKENGEYELAVGMQVAD
ncbi:MAG: inner membrane protein [Saprospiraceae bacterium]|jgi:inner membrane protein|tara:strand:+ start:1152 stop:2120 length:969 start_codon:yes stop_codon:yes gene_type:complete